MRLLLVTILLTAGLSAQAAQMYCNAQGRECTDRPTGSANIARSTGPASPPTRVAPATGTGAAGGTTAPNADPGAPPDSGTRADAVAEQQRRNAALAAANKALQKDLADKRSEQCRKAQEYYKQAIEATTIYRTSKDGKKEVLTEAEANQSRLSAKLEIERTCGKGGS
jgi:hypothetical protein